VRPAGRYSAGAALMGYLNFKASGGESVALSSMPFLRVEPRRAFAARFPACAGEDASRSNFTASRRLVSSGAGGCSVAVVFLPPIDLARGASASRVLSG
jgi:hypothetical protein